MAVWLWVWLFSGAKQITAFLPTVFQDFVFPFLEDGFAWIEGLLGWNHKLQRWTFRFATKVSGHIEKRIGRSYPAILREKEETVKDQERCGFAQVFWLFLIGALAGDIVETIFCRVTSGIWMSRSSLVWGPFSVVWGIAAVVWIKCR